MRYNITYKTIRKISDPLVIAEYIDAGYNEIVLVKTKEGIKKGRVIGINKNMSVIEVFGGTAGLDENAGIMPTAKTAKVEVSENMHGRIFSGAGEGIDGRAEIIGKERDINGYVINPALRAPPNEMIETGFSAIDGLNTLMKGQKLGIFSGAGMPHYEIATEIVLHANAGENFSVIFCGMGINHEIEDYFMEKITESNIMDRTIVFMNRADDPTVESILAPRYALTTAEYLAFEKERDVLVILIDMTNYCNALRELSNAKEEIPTRMGYPAYMYSDLASIYERCGALKGKKGTITELPILTMPNEDITHPIPDLTGYISEGQIVMSKILLKKGIYPPIDILSSLSRMMHNGASDEHREIADKIYHNYAEGKRLEESAMIIGYNTLNSEEKLQVEFYKRIENDFIHQSGPRSLRKTLEIGKQILAQKGWRDNDY